MAVNVLSILTQTQRRSAQAASGVKVLTGRWVKVDANGAVVPPATTRQGLYLVFEGTTLHVGSPTDFAGASPFASTKSVDLPMSMALGPCALIYGIYRYQVGPEGVDPAATFVVNGLVTVDADGRLIPQAAGADAEDNAVGTVEAVKLDAGNKVVSITIRTPGK